MASNQNVNKVVYAGTTLIDLTGDDVTAGDVLSGKKFHLPSGAEATGTMPNMGAISGILKGDGAGNVSAATAGTDYLAPSALTPYRTAAAQDEIDAEQNSEITLRLPIANNAGFHNSIYRGKNLGTSVTAEQYAAISAGTFDNMFIGDYWVINNVNWRVAAFDYWLRTGDKNWNDGNGNYNVSFETTHHIVIVPDTNLYSAQMHNTSTGQYTDGAANNPVTGAYVGSDMYKTNLARAKTIVNDAFGAAHVLNHREHLQNAATNGYSTGGAWYDSTVDLMNEQMVYGCRVFGNVLNGTNWPNLYTNSKSQLPLFALEPSRICNRATWWLRDVASSTYFALVAHNGFASANNSSNSFGVRPAFGIKA